MRDGKPSVLRRCSPRSKARSTIPAEAGESHPRGERNTSQSAAAAAIHSESANNRPMSTIGSVEPAVRNARIKPNGPFSSCMELPVAGTSIKMQSNGSSRNRDMAARQVETQTHRGIASPAA